MNLSEHENMFTETPVAENAGDKAEPSVIDLDYALGNLSVSHEVTLADESSMGMATSDVSDADLLTAFDTISFHGNSKPSDDVTKDSITADSVSGIDPFGQRPDMRKDITEFNSAFSISVPPSQTDCEAAVLGEIDGPQQSDHPLIVYTSSQRSSHNNKSNQINESRQTSQIYTEINKNDSVVDLSSLQISRRRRSLFANRPRSVAWGSIGNSLPDFEEQSGPGPSLGKGKKSSGKRGVKKSMNSIKDQGDKKSLQKGCTPGGRISLKIKIGNKTIHESFDSKGNKVAEELPGNMTVPLERNLEKVTSTDASVLVEKVTSTDASVLENPSFNISSYRHKLSSQVAGADLLASSENRCSDVGTSPDSEVINSVPEAPHFDKVSQSMQGAPIISSNACASTRDISSFSSPKMKSKNGAEATVGTEVPELGLINSCISRKKSTKCSTAKGKKEKASKKKGNKNDLSGKDQMNEVVGSSAVLNVGENHLAAVIIPINCLGHETPSDLGESGTPSKDLSGAMNGLQFSPSEERNQFDPLRNAWVLCDKCEKWRRIPATIADQIEETNSGWTCKDNTDKDFADCSIPQEKSNSEINKELEIPDEDVCDAVLMSNQNQSKVTKEAPWSLIKSNLFLHRSRKKQTIDEVMVCHCKVPTDGRMGCRAKCLNRILNIECVKGTCPCGERCSNQQFQKRKYAKLKCFKSGKKGYGLQSLEDISEGQFLTEYIGEVLDMHAYEARQRQYAVNGHKHFYFMTLNGSEVIDACAKGNLGRFINHSCDPNCRTEKWMVNGEVCVGLFAIRDIKKGEEVTFDYNYVRVFGAAAKKCVCGSVNCRGYIGGDPTNSEIIVQSDSDDEYPEPVMVTEDGEIKSMNIEPVMVTEQEIANESPENSLRTKDRVSEVTHLETIAGANISETLTQKVDVDSISTIANEDKFEEDNFVDKIYTDNAVEELDVSALDACTVESDEFQSQKQKPLSYAYEPTKSLLDIVEHKTKLKYADAGDKDELVKSSSLAKTKHSASSIKKGKIKVSVSKEKGTAERDRLNTMPNKSKKQPQSLNSQFEAVEEKLNDLLEPEGGISKRKDASKGYLKLLFLTAASGNNVHGEAIQSNRDLSMILDALLKTKSRSVLVDIINKNGLQMLHNIMKRYRKEFNKTPILRKLLKVLEYLAMREILTLEHITGGPPRPGVESFKDSILTLTEHLDKQVHQIARNFRDRWIPRSFRKRCCTPRDDRMIESSHATPTHSKFSLSHDHHHHPSEKPSETPLSSEIQSPATNPSSTIDQTTSATNNNETSEKKPPHKRKSRWDTPPDDYANSKPKTNSEPDIDDDKPPGFSSPCHRPIVSSDGQYRLERNLSVKHPFGVVLGNSQPGFVSRIPVSYGIPSSIVQQFGTEASIGWAVAPSLPFCPFPPLPSYEKGNRPIEVTENGKKHARTWGVDAEGNDTDFQRGGSSSLERKYFRQQKLNHSKLAPPWVRMRNGWGSAQEM